MVTATLTERERQRKLKAEQGKKERDIAIPPVANPERRAACEADSYLFLRTYFPAKFTDEFTDDRREMVEAILYRSEHGGDQTVAAPRGEGKTTIAECVVIYCVVTGRLKFPLIGSSTGPDAKRILANVKYEFETNDLLAEDFPEVCVPIRALEGAPQRANMQTVDGQRTYLKWAEDYIIMPTVPGSKASGAIIAARGLDGAVRGVRYRNTRPDFVLLDDPETRESAESPMQIAKREAIIEQDVAGLGGPGKRIARVMLCTIMKVGCIADKYSDPKQKPSWNGKRYRLLAKPPDREDMWEEYMRLREEGQARGDDRDGREAHAFYLANRAEMDAGAVLSNPNRYVKDTLPDGTQAEVSALQHCYNIISDRGWSNFATEYQNDPPEDEGPQESGINAPLVRKRLSGMGRNICSRHTEWLVAAIDLGKHACHYCVTSWRGRYIGDVIAYGVQDVHNSDVIGTEKALVQALKAWRDEHLTQGFVTEDGELRRLDMVLIDAGNWDSAVYEFIAQSGAPFYPSKGVGDQRSAAAFTGGGSQKRVGDHWYVSRQANGIDLIHMDTDWWKRFLHDRWMTEAYDENAKRRDGSLTLFGDNPNEHVSFSQHQVAEVEVEEFVPGKGLKRMWKKRNKNNHWLDAAYMCCVAGSLRGMSLERERIEPKRQPVTSEERASWASKHKGRW